MTNTSYGLDIYTKALVKYLFHSTYLKKGTLKVLWNEFHLTEPNHYIHHYSQVTVDRLVLKARQNDEMAIEFIKVVSGSINPMEECDQTIKSYLKSSIVQVLIDSFKNCNYSLTVYVREDFIPQTQGMTMIVNSEGIVDSEDVDSEEIAHLEENAETLVVWFQGAKIADLYLTRNFWMFSEITPTGVEAHFVGNDTGILAFKIECKNVFKLHITNYGKTFENHCQNVREIIDTFQSNEMISDTLVNAIVESFKED